MQLMLIFVGKLRDGGFMTAPRGLAFAEVLLVEDDVLISASIGEVLRNAGARLAGPVSTLAAATSLIMTHRPDVVIVDLNLKGRSTFDFADELRGIGVALVFVTGYDPFIIPARFADIPVLPKPICASQLIETLELAMQEKV